MIYSTSEALNPRAGRTRARALLGLQSPSSTVLLKSFLIPLPGSACFYMLAALVKHIISAHRGKRSTKAKESDSNNLFNLFFKTHRTNHIATPAYTHTQQRLVPLHCASIIAPAIPACTAVRTRSTTLRYYSYTRHSAQRDNATNNINAAPLPPATRATPATSTVIINFLGTMWAYAAATSFTTRLWALPRIRLGTGTACEITCWEVWAIMPYGCWHSTHSGIRCTRAQQSGST